MSFCFSSFAFPFEIQIRLSFTVSFFCFFESSTFFQRLAILLVTSFLCPGFLVEPSSPATEDFVTGVTGRRPSLPATAGLDGR